MNSVLRELKKRAPFTAVGTVCGVPVLGLLTWTEGPRSVSVALFWTLHPVHVLLSALVTTAMFRLHGGHGLWAIVSVGYFASVGIATLSDCLLPFVGEWLLALPHRGLHLGFIEKWWLVNPLAFTGIAVGYLWRHTKCPHASHVLLSTWACFISPCTPQRRPGLSHRLIGALSRRPSVRGDESADEPVASAPRSSNDTRTRTHD